MGGIAWCQWCANNWCYGLEQLSREANLTWWSFKFEFFFLATWSFSWCLILPRQQLGFTKTIQYIWKIIIIIIIISIPTFEKKFFHKVLNFPIWFCTEIISLQVYEHKHPALFYVFEIGFLIITKNIYNELAPSQYTTFQDKQ